MVIQNTWNLFLNPDINCRSLSDGMLQRLLAVLPRSQQSGYQIPTKMPNLFDDSLNASGIKIKLLLTVQSCVNKLPGVIHLPINTKPHITELLLMKTVMTLKNYGKFCVLPCTVSLTRFFHQIVHKKIG